MKRSEYCEEMNQLEAAKQDASTAYEKCVEARLHAASESRDAMFWAATQEEAARVRLAVIDRQIAELSRRLEEEGFDYERPRKWTNRFLPRVPEETTEPDFGQALPQPEYPRQLAAAGAFLAVATSIYCFGFLPRWFAAGLLYPFTAPVHAAASSVNPLLWLGLVVVLLFVLRISLRSTSPMWLQSVFDEQARFVYGAEQWTTLQRLRSCLVYSVASVGTMVAPLLLIPGRFALISVTMGLYLRKQKRADASAGLAVSSWFVVKVGREITTILVALMLVISLAMLFMSM